MAQIALPVASLCSPPQLEPASDSKPSQATALYQDDDNDIEPVTLAPTPYRSLARQSCSADKQTHHSAHSIHSTPLATARLAFTADDETDEETIPTTELKRTVMTSNKHVSFSADKAQQINHTSITHSTRSPRSALPSKSMTTTTSGYTAINSQLQARFIDVSVPIRNPLKVKSVLQQHRHSPANGQLNKPSTLFSEPRLNSTKQLMAARDALRKQQFSLDEKQLKSALTDVKVQKRLTETVLNHSAAERVFDAAVLPHVEIVEKAAKRKLLKPRDDSAFNELQEQARQHALQNIEIQYRPHLTIPNTQLSACPLMLTCERLQHFGLL